MAPVNRTDAQFEARKNHYLEKIGKGKPKAKGTKSNPYKGKDLAKLLKERFNKKQASNNAAAPKANINELPQLVQNEKQKAKALTYGEAHQIQNNISDESKNALTKLRDEMAAKKEAPKAVGQAPAREAGAPKSGVVEADRRAAEVIKRNAAQNALKQEALANAENINKPFSTSAAQIDKQLGMGHKNPVAPGYADEVGKLLDEQDAAKNANVPKTSKKYKQPKSGVVEADRRAAEAIKNKALANAEAINKPFTTTPEKIDRQLGIDKKYNVPKNYAEEYGKLMDEKYGKVKPPVDGAKPPISGTKPPVTPGVAKAGEEAVENGIKNTTKKPGFFKKIGNFFKGKKGKWALAGAAIIGLAALCLSKCTGGKDKVTPPTPTPEPTPPTPPTPPTEPTNDKYCIETEEGKMPKSYTIQKGDYPVGIIADTYGVAYGTPEFKEIQKAVYEASDYKRNTNLKVGDKFTLPDVTIGDKVYTADENAKVRKGIVVDNGLKLGRTKEVVKAGDKYYIVYCESGQRVPNEPAFDDMDKACKRIDALLEAEKAEEEKKAA